MTDFDHRVLDHPTRNTDTQWRPREERDRRGGSGRRLLGLGALLLLIGGLAVGVWWHYTRHLEVTVAAEQHRDFVPSVRVEAVRASADTMSVTLPATPTLSRLQTFSRAQAGMSRDVMSISALE